MSSRERRSGSRARAGHESELTGFGVAPAKTVESGSAGAAARARRAERLKRNVARARARRTRSVALLIGAVVVFGALVGLYRSNIFAVRSVQVVGVKRLTVASVRARVALPANATLLRFPSKDIKYRLATDPWVASVEIKRVFPHTLRIVVSERTAVALLSTGNAMWPIDRSGVVLARESLDTTASMMVIRDVPRLKPRVGQQLASDVLDNALAVSSGIGTALRNKTQAISAPSIGETTLLTDGGVEVLIGKATSLSTKDAIVRRILREQAGKVVFIDVRSTDRPVWRGLQK